MPASRRHFSFPAPYQAASLISSGSLVRHSLPGTAQPCQANNPAFIGAPRAPSVAIQQGSQCCPRTAELSFSPDKLKQKRK